VVIDEQIKQTTKNWFDHHCRGPATQPRVCRSSSQSPFRCGPPKISPI